MQVTHTDGRLRFDRAGRLVGDDRFSFDRLIPLHRAAGIEGSPGFLMESCSPNTPLFLHDIVLLCTSTYTDGRFLPRDPGLYQTIRFVARSDWSLAALDTIGIFPGARFAMYRAGGRMYSAPFGAPWSSEIYTGVSGSPPRFTFTDVNGPYRIEVHSLVGPRRLVVIERAGAMRTPTTIEHESLERVLSGNRLGRRQPPGDVGSVRRQITPRDSISIVVGAPIVDQSAHVWARIDPDGDVVNPQRRFFDVFDPTGLWLGQVEMPWQFRIREIGVDYVLGTTTDDLGVEYVVMYRLRGRQ